jgi:hypothetical protein
MELDLALPVLKEPVDTLRQGLRAGGFRAEAAAPHPVQAFQATVRVVGVRMVGWGAGSSLCCLVFVCLGCRYRLGPIRSMPVP